MRKKVRFLKKKKWGRGEKNYHKQRLSALVCSPKESEVQRQKSILHSVSVVLLRDSALWCQKDGSTVFTLCKEMCEVV